MMNQTGPSYMDPRGSVGILSRGQNIYGGASYSPKVGQGQALPQQQGQFAPIAAQQLANQKILPPNSMTNVNFQQVAKWLQAQSSV